MTLRLGGRPQVLAGLVAAVLALTTVAPGFAQSSPSGNPAAGNGNTAPGANVAGTAPSGTPATATNTVGGSSPSSGWIGAPDAQGSNTYVGRIESPRNGQTNQPGANLLVSGWAADTTAQGWAGFDQMQVYSGDRTTGTKLADGSVGLNRPDVADALGPNFLKSGFSATVPSSALGSGPMTLTVYLHTASKGWWYRTVSVNQQTLAATEFGSDPIVDIIHPVNQQIMTVQQFLNRYVIVGYALDRNDVTDPGNQSKLAGPLAGPGEAGIGAVTVYIDAMPGMPGYNAAVNLIGNAGLGVEPAVNNQGPPAGPVQLKASYPTLTRQYGPQYEWAGWVATLDTRTLQPDSFHTLYAVARSSVQCLNSTPSSCKTSSASSTFYLKSSPSANDRAACSVLDVIKHKGCAILSS